MKTRTITLVTLLAAAPLFSAPPYVARIDLPAADPTHAAAADLDGDSDLDVVVVSDRDRRLYVYYGRGDGTFAYPPESHPTDRSPIFVALGDLTDDGLTSLPDILLLTLQGRVAFPVGNAIDGDLAVFANAGTAPGTPDRFAAVCDDLYLDGTAQGNGNQPRFAALGYLDGNARLDIAAAGVANQVQVLFQGFSNPDTDCAQPAVCDFGFSTSAQCTPVVTGADEFQALAIGPFAPAIHFWNDVVTLNHTTTDRNRGVVRYHLHLGQDQTPLTTLPPGTGNAHEYLVGDGVQNGVRPTMLAADLLNGDTIPDLVISDADSAQISVFEALSTGSSTSAIFRKPTFEFPANENPVWVATGEFQVGSATAPARDALVANQAIDMVSVVPGTGTSPGYFRQPLCYPAGASPGMVSAGRINADNQDDVLTTNADGSAASVLLGRLSPNGGFDVAYRRRTGGSPVAVAAGDLNSDSRLDLVAVNDDTLTLASLLGRNDGSFDEIGYRPAVPAHPVAVAVDHLDADSLADAAVLSDLPGMVSIFLSIGNGAFRPAGQMPVPDDASALVATALDPSDPADPVDLLVAAPAEGRILVFHGNGDGTFTPGPDLVVAGETPTYLTIADFDLLDGDDIAFTTGGDVRLLLNDGSGGFTVAGGVAVGPAPATGVTAGDVNGDGGSDLVITQDNGDLTVLLGDGAGSFPAGQQLNLPYDPAAPLLGEFNGVGGQEIQILFRATNSSFVIPWTITGMSLADANAFGVGRNPRAAVSGRFDSTATIDSIVVADTSLPDDGHGLTVLTPRRLESYPPADAGPDQTICAGQSVTIGTPAKAFLSYQWAPATGLDLPATAEPTATPAATTTYTLTVASPAAQNGLSNTDTVTVRVVSNPAVTITPDPATLCGGGAPIVLDAGPGFISYLWSTGETTRTISVRPAATTTYSVSVTTPAGPGCPGSGMRQVEVGTPATPQATVPASVCQAAGSTTLNATDTTVPPPGSTLTRRWFLIGPSCPAWCIRAGTETQATAIIDVATPATPTSATLRLEITSNPAGCITTADFPLSVLASGPADIGNSLRAVKRPGTDVQISWSSAATPFAVHRVTTPAAIPTIFGTAPVTTAAAPPATISETNPLAFYGVQGQCP